MYGWENVIVAIIAAPAIQTRLVIRTIMNSIDRTAPMSLGNPPNKPKVPEVEFSKKEVLREEVKIYGQPNHGCFEAC